MITDLLSDCEVFNPDPDIRQDYEIGKKELKDSVQKIITQIQKFYD